MSLETQGIEFGEFFLDLKEKALLRGGERLPINPKTFQLLVTLLENQGHLVEKDQLMRTLWPDSFVEEANLAFTVSLLRKTLGDDAQNPAYIQTIPRRGYRFVGPTPVKRAENYPTNETSFRPAVKHRVILTAVSVLILIALFVGALAWMMSGARSADGRGTPVALTNDGKITIAVVTPDGSQIVFSRKEGVGEALWRKEIASGDQIQLIPARAVEYTGLSVSPKSDFAYFSVFSENNAVGTLARIPLAGGQPESIPSVPVDVSVTFSPSGEKIAFTENVSSLNETYLKTANADGSGQKTLLTTKGPRRDLPIFRASPAAWSPDGKVIAVAIRESDENGSYYKVLLGDAENGSESDLTDVRWNDVSNIAWLSDGELILIDSEPGSANKDIWRLSVRTGERTKLTTEKTGFQWLSASGGKVYTVQKKTLSGVFVAEFEESSRILRSKQIYAEANSIDTVAWTKSGQVLFNSGESGKNEIWRVNPNGTSPQQITSDSGLSGPIAVSPIDDSLIFSASKDRRIVLVWTDAAGQNARQLTDGVLDTSPTISADGRSVVFQRGTMKPTLWKVDLDGVTPASQITGYFSQNPRYSSDGSVISFHFMDFGEKDPKWKLGLIDSVTNRLISKLDFPEPVSMRDTDWHSTTGYVTMTFGAGNGAGLLFMNPMTGAFYTVGDVSSGFISSLAWSRDGRSLAFAEKHRTSDVVELSAAR